MGVDLFDGNGHPITCRKITADPPDINILPEYELDPRVVSNLIDGVNHTCDDLHAWLCPFTAGQNHEIYIEMDQNTSVGMIRIWNYNKSRIHSYRGARYSEIMLDSNIIFKGEIKRASGEEAIRNDDESIGNCSECILFTRNEVTLKMIEKYDKSMQQSMLQYDYEGEGFNNNVDNGGDNGGGER